MHHIIRTLVIVAAVATCVAALTFAHAQQAPVAGPRPAAAQAPRDYPEDHRPPLVFRESWQDPTPGVPTDYHDKDLNAHLENKTLQHGWYGAGAKDIQYVRHLGPKDDPGYIWLGACAAGPCVLTLKDKNDFIDMSGMSRIAWRTKQGGFRQLRLVLKLADGSWLISDRYAGPAEDWNVQEILMKDIRWKKFIVDKVYEDAWVEKPDLSKVDEIGFTDLMNGGPGFSSGTSRVDWIEVYGNRVKRSATSNNN